MNAFDHMATGLGTSHWLGQSTDTVLELVNCRSSQTDAVTTAVLFGNWSQ